MIGFFPDSTIHQFIRFVFGNSENKSSSFKNSFPIRNNEDVWGEVIVDIYDASPNFFSVENALRAEKGKVVEKKILRGSRLWNTDRLGFEAFIIDEEFGEKERKTEEKGRKGGGLEEVKEPCDAY